MIRLQRKKPNEQKVPFAPVVDETPPPITQPMPPAISQVEQQPVIQTPQPTPTPPLSQVESQQVWQQPQIEGPQPEEISSSTKNQKGYFSDLTSFSCKGRLNRARFWKNIVITYILAICAFEAFKSPIIVTVLGIASIPFFIRRFHDLNRSGWFLLTMFIPYVNILISIYAGFFKGTDGPNDYGPDPLQ